MAESVADQQVRTCRICAGVEGVPVGSAWPSDRPWGELDETICGVCEEALGAFVEMLMAAPDRDVARANWIEETKKIEVSSGDF